MKHIIGYQKGFTVIEIMVVVAILLSAFVGIFGLLVFSLQISILVRETNQANFLAQDTIEAVRNFRDGTVWDINGLGTLIVDTVYYPEKTIDNPPAWTMIQGEETIDIFSRKVIFENVMRDANDNIVGSGGISDPDTKKVTATVSWKGKKVEIITYLTNWK